MNRHDADRYEGECVQRAGGIGTMAPATSMTMTEMLTAVLRNAPLAPSDNQGRLRNEPETPVA